MAYGNWLTAISHLLFTICYTLFAICQNRIADLHERRLFDARHNISHFPCRKFCGGFQFWHEITDFFYFQLIVRGDKLNIVSRFKLAVEYSHERDNAFVVVVERIKDQGTRNTLTMTAT